METLTTLQRQHLSMGADKRIPVTEDTWEALGDLKGAGQTYDELIGELIEDYGHLVGEDE